MTTPSGLRPSGLVFTNAMYTSWGCYYLIYNTDISSWENKHIPTQSKQNSWHTTTYSESSENYKWLCYKITTTSPNMHVAICDKITRSIEVYKNAHTTVGGRGEGRRREGRRKRRSVCINSLNWPDIQKLAASYQLLSFWTNLVPIYWVPWWSSLLHRHSVP